jgi:hypothetical protein
MCWDNVVAEFILLLKKFSARAKQVYILEEKTTFSNFVVRHITA